MKIAIAFALFAACMAAPVPQAVDWAGVAGKVRAIEGIITDASTKIRSVANADNPTVGGVIGSELDAAAVKAKAQLEKASAAIQAQTLTEAQAREIFGELQKILADVRARLAQSVAQLSPAAQQEISTTLNSAFEAVSKIANEIYAALAAFAPQAVNWTAVAGKVSEVEKTITDASTKIRSVANADNPTVGSAIGTQLDAAAVKAKAQLEKAAAAIQAQTLTEAQAKEIFAELQKVLADLRANLASSVAQLSPAAQQEISATLTGALDAVTKLANDIYALLAAFAPQAVNWTAVAGKVSDVEKAITDASTKIRSVANADNPTVGSAIGTQLDAAAVKAKAQLEKAAAAIQAQTLTEAQAKEIFAELQKVLADLRANLASSVAQLSPAAQQEISATLTAALDAVTKLANDIYALLAAFAPQAVNWTAVAAKVSEVEKTITDASTKVRSVANADNPTVGSTIGTQLDAAAVKAKAQLEKAAAAIQAQTLTEAQAKEIFAELQKVLTDLRASLASSVAQLSPAAQQQISAELEGALTKVTASANEIYALLRA